MISKITLENFFSFRGPTTIALNPEINILLGINGSGKTNFLRAIQFLYESIVGDGLEKIFLRDWSGFSAVANFSGDKKDYIKLSFEFNGESINNTNPKGYQFHRNPTYDIFIFKSGETSYYLKEKLYSKNEAHGEKDFIYMEMDHARGVVSTRKEGKVGLQAYPQENGETSFKPTEPVLRQISDPDRFSPLFTLKTALEEISAYYHYDTTDSSPTRRPSGYTTEKKLLPSGENLAAILNKIKNGHSLYYDKVEKAIKKINPYFRDIGFELLGSKAYLTLREENLAKTVSIEHISDGTLRYMLLLAILCNPKRGSLVCIDEPEVSLHPDMIHTVSDAIKDASKETQMIIATHSPLFLNSFEIEDVLIFDKNIKNETEVSVKSHDEFDGWIEDFLVGQAWLQGLIGGKRW
jgi:predicted ATPase